MLRSVCMFCGPSDQSETHNSHPLNLFFPSFNRPVWQPQAQQLNWNRVVPLIRRDIRSNKQKKKPHSFHLPKRELHQSFLSYIWEFYPFKEAKGWTCRHDGPKVCYAASMANLLMFKQPHLFKMDSCGEGEVVLRAAGHWSHEVFTLSRLELLSGVSVNLKWLCGGFIVHLSGSAVKQQMRMMNPSSTKAWMWKSLSVK